MEDVPQVVEAQYGRGGILDSILYVLQDMGSGSNALGSARLGLHLLMGDGTKRKVENNIHNLAEGRFVVIQAVAAKA